MGAADGEALRAEPIAALRSRLSALQIPLLAAVLIVVLAALVLPPFLFLLKASVAVGDAQSGARWGFDHFAAVLASRRFPNARIDAVDISKGALEVAARNVADYGLENRISLHRGDLFAPLGGKRYDVIISNPPYVDAQRMADLPRECRAEPKLAFDGGADGLAVISRILKEARRHLTPDGGLLCEIGRGREQLEAAFPELPLLWLDTEESEGEVFWIGAGDL